jgi:hypothetical protein
MIGVNGTERGEDAVAFVRRLGAFAGGRLVLTDAFPYDDLRGRHTSLAYREALREDSQAMLVAVRDPLRPRCFDAPGRRHLAGARCTSSRRTTALRWSSSAPRTSTAGGGCCRQHRRAPAARLAVRRCRGPQGLSRDRA